MSKGNHEVTKDTKENTKTQTWNAFVLVFVIFVTSWLPLEGQRCGGVEIGKRDLSRCQFAKSRGGDHGGVVG